jgi:hypothetical protein
MGCVNRIARGLVLCGAIVLAGGLAAAAGTDVAASGSGCQPAGSSTVIENREIRVFIKEIRTRPREFADVYDAHFGCLRSVGNPVFLGASDIPDADHFALWQLAAPYVAFYFNWPPCGSCDDGIAEVVTVNLRSKRQRSARASSGGGNGASVKSLVLKQATGATAWISEA